MKLDLILTNDWLEATWYKEEVSINEETEEETVTKTQVHCESFSGHPEHITMLRAKITEYGVDITTDDELMIAEAIKNFKHPTEAELAHQAKEQARQEAITTIAQLEASQLRSIRELMLDANNQYAKDKLEEIEAKIQEARAKL